MNSDPRISRSPARELKRTDVHLFLVQFALGIIYTHLLRMLTQSTNLKGNSISLVKLMHITLWVLDASTLF